ncbi:MAG: TonB-dependent receptor [Cyclobacteriaceae bacterium]
MTGYIRTTDGVPLSDVHVQVTGLSGGAVTGQDGQFELRVPPRDSVAIRISCVGYVTLEQIVHLPMRDSLIIGLQPSRLQLDEVIVVSATRAELQAHEVIASVSQVTIQQLDQLVPRTTPEALMGATGVWVQKTNHGGGSPIIRGLVGNQVLVLIDGIRLNNSTYRYGPNQYLNTIDIGSVRQIEVMRGGGSVLYGSDALGGSVQLVSAAPSFSTGRQLTTHGQVESKFISGGMEKTGRGAVSLSNNRFAFRAGGSFRDFGSLTAGPLFGTLVPTAYQEKALDAKLLVLVNSTGMLTGTFQQTTQRHVPRYDQVAFGGFERFEFEPQTRQLGYLRWETTNTSRFWSALRLTGIWQRTREGIHAQRVGSIREKINDDRVSTWGATAEVNSQLSSNWQAQSGVEFYEDRVSSTAEEINLQTGEQAAVRGSFADGATMKNMALFTHHQLTWPRLAVTAGARYNLVQVRVADPIFGSQQIQPSATVFSAAVRWEIIRPLRLLASVNSGFRAPNVDDISRFGPVEATVYEIPSGQLQPERSLNSEFGFQFLKPSWSARSVVYYNRLKDLIDRRATTYEGLDQIDGRQVYQKQNVGRAYVWGWETEGEFRLSDFFKMGGNLTYTFGQNETTGDAMRRIPPMFGSWFGQVQLKKFWARLEWQAAGSQQRLAKGDLSDVRISSRLTVDKVFPGWDIWNMCLGYELNPFEIQMGVQNLLNASYRVYASGVDGYGLSFWISGRWRW